MGWLTVVLYALGVWQCFRLLSRQRNLMERREVSLWWIVTVGLLALGINKQLDLQSAMTEIGRIVARNQGWYETRFVVQVYFIYSVAACAAFTITALAFLARKAHAATIVATAGSVCLLAFIVVRAASFHRVDLFLGSEFIGLKMNWILEMSGIGIILAGAHWRRLAHTKPVNGG